MSAAVLSYDRSSTPVAEADIDLTQDWGEAGPPPPHAPRLQRQNATVGLPSSSEDEVEVEILEPRVLFPAVVAAAAAPIEEHAAGMHADFPLLDRVHFTSTFYDDLYDYTGRTLTIAKIKHNFQSILELMNRGIAADEIAELGTAVYVVPLMMPTGNTWRFQTFRGSSYMDAGAIPLKDLGISEDLALEYMACDYLRQTFINRRYFRAPMDRAAAIAEINAILEHQCALHMALVGFIVK
jgi:hypothetical protein